MVSWEHALTAVFVVTGLVCLLGVVRRRTGSRTPAAPTPGDVVDVNHGAMSAAMILMIWAPAHHTWAWAQALLFTCLAGLMLAMRPRAARRARQVDVAAHVLLNVAMVWMLVVTPIHAGDDAGAHAGHGAHAGGHESTSTGTGIPTVTEGLALGNLAIAALCAAGTLWWTWRTVRACPHHRLHVLCHALMAAGTGLMLFQMSGR